MAPKQKTNKTVNFKDQKGIKIYYSTVQTDTGPKRYAYQFTQQRQGKNKNRYARAITHPSKRKTRSLATLPPYQTLV
jgi:hypothetical protein